MFAVHGFVGTDKNAKEIAFGIPVAAVFAVILYVLYQYNAHNRGLRPMKGDLLMVYAALGGAIALLFVVTIRDSWALSARMRVLVAVSTGLYLAVGIIAFLLGMRSGRRGWLSAISFVPLVGLSVLAIDLNDFDFFHYVLAQE